jgi:hypothetical protein
MQSGWKRGGESNLVYRPDVAARLSSPLGHPLPAIGLNSFMAHGAAESAPMESAGIVAQSGAAVRRMGEATNAA